MSYTFVEGGVCAAKGFSAGAVHAGIRKNRTKNDLALIAVSYTHLTLPTNREV